MRAQYVSDGLCEIPTPIWRAALREAGASQRQGSAFFQFQGLQLLLKLYWYHDQLYAIAVHKYQGNRLFMTTNIPVVP